MLSLLSRQVALHSSKGHNHGWAARQALLVLRQESAAYAVDAPKQQAALWQTGRLHFKSSSSGHTSSL